MDLVLLIPLWIAMGLVTAVGVAVIQRWAERRSVLDRPNPRSSHSQPMPRAGGLPIVLVLLAGWGGLALHGDVVAGLWGGMAGFVLMALISWRDDLRGVTPGIRFLVQLIATALVLYSFGAWTHVSIPLLPSVPLGIAGILISALWIIGLTNAYNFMDGIDGIAGGQAVMAGAGWVMVGAAVGMPWIVATGGMVVAASAGFLLFNWNPARIFLGDIGSAPLGYLFAMLPFVAMTGASSELAARIPVAAALLVWPFIFDALFTFGRRLIRREEIFSAHRSHLYQRLVIAGWNHRRVAILYVGLAGAGVPAAYAWLSGGLWISAAAAASALLMGAALVVLVWQIEQGRKANPPRGSKSRAVERSSEPENSNQRV